MTQQFVGLRNHLLIICQCLPHLLLQTTQNDRYEEQRIPFAPFLHTTWILLFNSYPRNDFWMNLWVAKLHLRLCRGFVNRSAIGIGVWRFVEGGEHGGAIRDGSSTSLPSFRSRNGGETLRAAINHYMAKWIFYYKMKARRANDFSDHVCCIKTVCIH
jgi:hypothetical protein